MPLRIDVEGVGNSMLYDLQNLTLGIDPPYTIGWSEHMDAAAIWPNTDPQSIHQIPLEPNTPHLIDLPQGILPAAEGIMTYQEALHVQLTYVPPSF